ncbi:TPA: hypothetical protein ACSP82_002862, partial [Aeromonas veronii]
MIYAIDKLFTKRLINGWVSSKKNDIDETFKVTLYNPVKKVACVNANNNRPDVKQAGLHQTGLCGFSFDCEAYEIKDGDLLFVLIEGNVTKKTTTTSFIYGDAKRHVREYNSFELDRGDFSIMDYSTHQLFEKFNHLIALKAILIRLRRHKRGKGGRGKFVGVNYLHKNSDFKMFMSILSVFRET